MQFALFFLNILKKPQGFFYLDHPVSLSEAEKSQQGDDVLRRQLEAGQDFARLGFGDLPVLVEVSVRKSLGQAGRPGFEA